RNQQVGEPDPTACASVCGRRGWRGFSTRRYSAGCTTRRPRASSVSPVNDGERRRRRASVMSGVMEIVLILAAIGYVLVRRMMGEAAQAKRMLILPAVLFVVGLTQSTGLLRSPAALLFVLVTCALSV